MGVVTAGLTRCDQWSEGHQNEFVGHNNSQMSLGNIRTLCRKGAKTKGI